MRRLRGFWAAEGGNTAILFGLAIIPIIAFSGGAVDFSHRSDVRAKVQSAADVAALAAARTIQAQGANTKVDRQQLRRSAAADADRIFRASLAGVVDPDAATPRIKVTDNDVSVSADIPVTTSFLAVIGIRSLSAVGFAEVNIPGPKKVEIAMVLDYSLSMVNNDKYIRMGNAAVEFIKKASQFKTDTKIGIVPFSTYVMPAIQQRYVRGTAAAVANTSISTCLLNRDYPYSAGSDTPYAAIPASRWPKVDPTDPVCQGFAAKSLAVHDLTTDFTSLTDAISAMRPIHLTNISLGAEIGWQLLSPNAPFDTAANAANPNVKKILILLTDGVQTVPAMGPSGGPSLEAANETTAELCTGMKAAKITVFTIAYDVDDPAAYNLLSKCASGPQEYHEVHDASGIGSVFEDIFAQIEQTVFLSR